MGELIEWHIKNKTDAIIVCGTTGESATMTDEERKKLDTLFIDLKNYPENTIELINEYNNTKL